MTAGIIDFEKPGDDRQPTPALWGACPRTVLNDLGLGHFIVRDFPGETSDLPGLPNTGDGTFTYAGDDRALRLTTGDTANNALAIYTRPLNKVVRKRNPSHGLWFETSIRLPSASLSGSAGFFVGLARADGLDDDLVSDTPADDAAAGLDDESVIGFVSRREDGDITKIDAVYRKGDGSVVTVVEDVTNSHRLEKVSHPGGVSQTDRTGDVKADEWLKLGVAYNVNTNQVQYFVRGVLVARVEVDHTVDQANEYGGIICWKTGTTDNRILDVDFFRAAAQYRT